MAFAHLHVHTQYSVLDGAATIDSLVNKAKELEMPALAITDHGNMFGAMEFFTKAKAQEIKPLIGCELYVAPRSRFERKGDTANEYQEAKYAYHLVMIASNKEGYDNLKNLVSLGYTEGFYRKPRVDHQLIEKYNKGIICTSACLGGELAQKIDAGKYEEAKQTALWYKEIFGDNYYIELQDQLIRKQRPINKQLFRLANETEIKMIVTNDTHYTEREDAKAQEALLAVQTQKKLSDPNRFRFETEEFYLKSEEEMRELFPKLPSAFDNTIEIADKCELDLQRKEYYMPKYEIPAGYKDESDFFKDFCRKGLAKRYADENRELNKEAKDRLEYELSVIQKMGFEGYFLIVQDFINHAKGQGILVGPGRGSAAGSIVSYSLGITEVNPLDYDLLFERFLNPERNSMPDIDVDFPDDRREEVINYCIEKYGAQNVAQIITFGTLNGRSSIRDICRVMDIELSTADKLAKLVPNDAGNKIDTKDLYDELPDFKRMIDDDPQLAKMYEIAKKLDGLTRNTGLHAAGVVISNVPITDVAPIYKDPKTKKIACQFEMNFIEESGLVKMDFLGIKNLRLMTEAANSIKSKTGEDFDINKIPLNDEKTLELFRQGDTSGVFQFESAGMRKMLRAVRPTRFEDLVAAVALYRPGPLGSGVDKMYADRKNGREKVVYKHPDLEPILKETYGGFLYQEQIMKTSQLFGGFTGSQADDLRKAMGKKKAEKMLKLKLLFIEGGVKKGYDEKLLDDIYQEMAEFAKYGFNKSHSVCYALVAYQEAFIKAHYPLHFFTALFNTALDNTEKIKLYLNDCRNAGIEIVGPDVQNCGAVFEKRGNKIAYGLAAIKGIGYDSAEEIRSNRLEGGEYASLYDFAQRVDTKKVGKKVYESLIKAGALNCFEFSQAALLNSLEKIVQYAQQTQRDKEIGQSTLFDSAPAGNALQGIQIEQMTEAGRLMLMNYELETIGFYLNHHPFNDYADKIPEGLFVQSDRMEELGENQDFLIAGIVNSVLETKTKRGKSMIRFTIIDTFGEAAFTLFSKMISKHKKKIEEGAAVIVHAKTGDAKNKYVNVEDIIDLDKALKGEVKVMGKKLGDMRKKRPVAKKSGEMNYHAEISPLYKDSGRVCIYCHEESFGDIDILALRDIISEHKGDVKLYFNIQKSDGSRDIVELGSDFRVTPSERFITSIHNSLRGIFKISPN